MKKFILLVLFALLLFASSTFANNDDYVEGEAIVIINDSYTYAPKEPYALNSYSEAIVFMAESFAESSGLVFMGAYSGISSVSGTHIVHLKSETKSTEELLQELAGNLDVKSVQPNYIRRPFIVSGGKASISSQSIVTPNDPDYANLWGMDNIGMPLVWEYNTGSENVCVAVIDSGIDYTHQDLNANMAKDSSGNYGRLFKDGKQSNNPIDTFGHGTHVAGIIGSVGNNNIGGTGVNWKVKMLAVNVMPQGEAYDSDVISGINYVISEKKAGLNIVAANMSFGGWNALLPDNSPLGAAVSSLSDAGIVCSIAVGNDGENISNPNAKHRNQRVYPACFKFANTISVGSIGSSNTKSTISNYGSALVDIAAPGDSIYSTTLRNSYGTMTGTSMSAAYVTGAAAILSSAFPNESAAQIKARILRGARNENNQGYWESGHLDVARAYGIDSSEPDEPLLSVTITGENSISAGYSTFLNYIKYPLNANGYFEYLWESSNESVVRINGKNNPSAEITGISGGASTITISVTQTMQNGTKITKISSFDIAVMNKTSSASSGCNVGLYFAALFVLLPALKFAQGLISKK